MSSGDKKRDMIILTLIILALAATIYYIQTDNKKEIGSEQAKQGEEISIPGDSEENTSDEQENKLENLADSNGYVNPEDVPSDVMYDLVTAVELSREEKEKVDYPGEGLMGHTEILDNLDKNKQQSTSDTSTSDTSTSVTGGTADHGEGYQVEVRNSDRINKFLEATNTETEDYERIYVAFYPENNYIVGAVQCETSKKAADILTKLEEYRVSMSKENGLTSEHYLNSKIERVGKVIFIYITNDASEKIYKATDYINEINQLLYGN